MSESNPKNLDPLSDTPGAHPVGAGAGAAAGAVFGATVGAAAGPVGMAIGLVAGGVVGGLSGKEVAEQVNPTEGVFPEEHKIEGGVGATIGAVAGGALGLAAGPIGVVALSATGAAVGEWVGQSVGEEVFSDDEDKHWRQNHVAYPSTTQGLRYEDYRPAYIMGRNLRQSGSHFDENDSSLSQSWEKVKGSSRLTWEEAKHAVRQAWNKNT